MTYMPEKKLTRSRNSRHLTMPPAVWAAQDEAFADFKRMGADMKEGDLIAAAVVLFLEQPRDVQIKLIQRGRAFDLERLQKQVATQDAARAEADFADLETTERETKRRRKTPA